MPYRKSLALLCAAAGLLLAQAPTPVADPVVAVIDGREFKKSDIEALLFIAPPDFQRLYQTNPKQALSTYMILQHLAKEARDRGVDKRSPLKEQIDFTLNDMLARAMVTEEENTFPVSNEMIEEYYRSHRDLFSETKYKAIVIRFQPPQGTSPEAVQAIAMDLMKRWPPEADVRKTAEDVAKQLRAGGDFADLLERFSNDESKAQGGAMPPLRPDSTVPADFRKAVEALQPGQVSDPLRQSNAYYVVRVDERVSRPIEELRGDIVMAIRRDHRNQWITNINNRYAIDVKDESFFAPKLPAGFGAIPGQK